MSMTRAAAFSVALLTVCAASASAQLVGHYLVGDFGLASGSQPAPGLYLVAPFARFDTDTIKGARVTR